MECRDIRETISACVDGEASPEETASVREHLASCERCRALERQMRAVGAGVRQVRESVPDGFREAVFARLDAEGALPPRKRTFSVSRRWTAVPLAAAAALGFFLLTSRDAVRDPGSPSSQGNAVSLSTEDREMIALLDLLEDPDAFDANGDADGTELLAPADPADSSNSSRGGRSGA